MKPLNRCLRRLASRPWALALMLTVPLVANGAADPGPKFATPEEAVSALAAAARSKDPAAIQGVLGSSAADLQNPDRVQATNDLAEFTVALDRGWRIVHETDSRCVLELGEKSWPFPIPIVLQGRSWSFDTEAGREEILSRRIGRNELATLEAVRGYVEAQREYAAKDRDGDQVLEYARSFVSSPGARDGLYWPPELDGEISPLGPFVAQAQVQGYGISLGRKGAAPEPFHGYFFKILTRQSSSAPGGAYDYIINGNMIGGFGLVAWPARYGETGIMTFIVNQQGVVYQRDLGPRTGRTAASSTTYSPGKGWVVSHE